MKSLVLSRFSPFEAHGGAAIRNCQTIQALAALGSVDVMTISEHPYPAEESRGRISATSHRVSELVRGRSPVEKLKAKLWRLVPGSIPVIDMYGSGSFSKFLEKRVREEGYDLAVIEELSLANHLPSLKRAGCWTVFDAHNVEGVLRTELGEASKGGATFGKRLIHRRTVDLERRVVCNADQVWVCSQVDADQIKQVYRRTEGIEVIPNGVDTDSYESSRNLSPDSWNGGPIELLFLGSYSYYPNEEAALKLQNELVPELRRRGRSVKLSLVGRDPTQAMLDSSKDDPDVEVTGAVDSVMPYLSRACLVVVPLTLGSGTRLKILEAFAAGRPVISSTKGAEGIECSHGKELFIADSVEEMADSVEALWDDEALRRSMCEDALQLVTGEYSWASAAKRIEQVIDGGARVPVQA